MLLLWECKWCIFHFILKHMCSYKVGWNRNDGCEFYRITDGNNILFPSLQYFVPGTMQRDWLWNDAIRLYAMHKVCLLFIRIMNNDNKIFTILLIGICFHFSLFHFFVLISSKLIGNVCSKIQVLLDRYTTLNKSMKQQTVLNESTSCSPYNYGIQTIFLFCYLPLLFTFYHFPHIHSNNHITIRLSFYSFWTRLIWLGYIPSTSVSSSLPRCIPSSSPSQSSYRCFLLLHKPWFTSGISFRRNYFKGNDSLCHGLCVIGDAK